MIAPTARPVPPRIVAVDPGSAASGVVVYDPSISSPVVYAKKMENDDLLRCLRCREFRTSEIVTHGHILVVEFPVPRGMPASRDLFLAVEWIGRFREAWGDDSAFVKMDRKDVKMSLCGVSSAKDTNIRAAIIDRFGGETVAIAPMPACPACGGKGSIVPPRVAVTCADCGGVGSVPGKRPGTTKRCAPCGGKGSRDVKQPRTDCATCAGTGRYGSVGPLYGVKADAWAALAVAMTYMDRPATGKEAT